ncbi:lipoprotein-releasing ABC transporter permease subunit LolE [Actinobacillus pleuropneumoniae]|uniref:Lipoprotein-releasing system transmembrane protein lolC n=1 Tax=Actinobacillus pleuropneumoniae serovar 6 str. Femo TaxID=754256 RepID=A0A828Q0B9_ACTPL|nr:lipoprotein-releasing ABC transporter permease subunit LolE [Actinobacillus pleuropneumoniae]EFL80618.1 outer membrane-specific lipoprotein transporter subunit LolE [Actinobacillus pleuropneumoniae serovar 6 str. Femo]EFM92982.1 Lipoprotein-releasing system transmembrane protein lolC [Actinobacillus pleuropneumoniae serovar 6 str. Femo]UKH12467.1 lipoprotein-releasing ABC transporter permease subunit LolE [Actinobacillus pleuropneumoniae serovar 6 str. Femo]SUU55780.1 outer membrane-specific
MNTPFFISWRYQRGKQKNRLVSLISLFSSIGIALGVAVLIIGLSAMNGFERELNQRVLSVVPHAELYSYNGNENAPIQTGKKLENLANSNPNVTASSPFVSFTGLIENGTQLKIAQVRGVDPVKQDKVSSLSHYIPSEQWQAFHQQGGLILGAGIAKDLEVTAGDEVTLLLPQPTEDGKLAQPLRFSLPVTGVLKLEGQLDHSYALLPIEKAQELLEYQPNEYSGIELALKAPFKVQELQMPELANFNQPLYLNTWIEKFGYMYNDIQLVRTVMYIAMVLVIGVACFNIISTLIMAVKDKQGDIAIMRTLGANNGFIKRIFLWYGLLSGMKGALAGIILGVILSLNLTAMIKAIEGFFGIKLLSDGVYFVDFLPSELHWQDVAYVLIATIVLSLFASLYPATRAAKLEPAKVLSGH